MDNLTGMTIFARVVEARSFSGAALQLGISKSAASKQVARLEDRLGVRLLNRTTRRLSLTEQGGAFYERCVSILADVEEAELAVLRLHVEPRGTLRVNAPVTFGHLHLAPAIADFTSRYPALTIDVTLNDRFVDVVDEGYDAVIRIAKLLDSSLIARKLAPNRRVVCASPEYLERHGTPQRLADLAEHNCLTYTYLATANEWVFSAPPGTEDSGEPISVRVGGNFRANNADALRAVLLDSVGIGHLPTFVVGEDLQTGRLQAVLTEFEDIETSVYAVYPQTRHLSAKVRAFVDFLVARFGPEPVWDTGVVD